MDQSGLFIFQAGSDVAADAEVRVLVDGAGDQAGNLGDTLFVSAEDVREGGREGGGGLDGCEVDLADVGLVGEAEDRLALIDVDAPILLSLAGE